MPGIRPAVKRFAHDGRAGFVKLRLLIDENLPADLAKALGETCVHAVEVASQPTDEMVWEYARREGCVIVTKDADFFDRLALSGAPPKVVWLRTGNMRRADLEAFMARHWAKVREMLSDADLVEIHADRIESIKF